jgi:class 3 adenylate cyclase
MIACPSCGASCPESSRFCGQCGSRLVRGPGDFEHRPVTALFCDLVGFTSLCETADAEDVERFLRDYYAAARDTVERFGGVVEKFIGDAVLGVFGLPCVHEDDAERAVRGGLALLESVRGLTSPGGVPTQVRIGIDSGVAVARPAVDPSSGEGLLMGDVINTAARLQQTAAPMQVIVGEGTHALTAHAIDYEAAPVQRVKGKRRAVATWVARRPIASAGIDLRRTFSTPLIGREAELGLLEHLFDAAVATSSPRIVLLTGEAGQGKSRLVLELAKSVDARPGMICTWRQGHCPPYAQESSYQVLGQILRQHAGILESDDAEITASKLDQVVGGGPDATWMRERLRPLLGLDAVPARLEESYAAWTGFLTMLARAHPAVIVFEDLHWGGSGAVEFFEYLATNAGNVPLMVIGTARPELAQHAPALVARFPEMAPSNARMLRLDIGALAAGETGRLVSQLAGDALTQEVHRTITRRCGGNPLYAEELVRWFEDPRARPGAGDEAREPDWLPESLRGFIAARLDALVPDEKSLLTDAAVVGPVFWPAVLVEMGERGEEMVTDGLADLVRRGFIRLHHTSSVESQEEYLFWHDIVRDVAYESLARGVRADKHSRVARWVEAQGLHRGGNAFELLVHHYTTSFDLARRAGNDRLAAEVRRPAAAALELAADRSLPLDYAASERYARRAVELVGASDVRGAALLVKWGAALQRRGRLGMAIDAIETGAIALLAAGRTTDAGRSLTRLSSALLSAGSARAPGVVTRALDLLEADQPTPDLVQALEQCAAVHLLFGEHDAAIAAADRAVVVAGELGLADPFHALETKAVASCAAGEAREGLAVTRRILEAIRGGRTEERTASPFVTVASLMTVYEGVGPALEVFREGRLHAQARHDHWADLTTRTGELESLLLLGEWTAVADGFEELEREFNAGDYLASGQDVRDLRRLLLSLQGDVARIRALTSLERDGSYSLSLSLHLLSVALAREATGDAAGALDLLGRLPDHPGLVSIPTMSIYWPCAIRLARDLGDPRLAVRLADVLLDSRSTPDAAKVTATALKTSARGPSHDAPELFEEAAERWRGHGVPFEEAQALFWSGRCRAEHGSPADAAAELDAAIDIFQRLGARPALTAARSLRRHVRRGPSPGRAPSSPARTAPD